MASDSLFDIVSKVDRQEVDNALNQATKEVSQRYDFKNIGASIAWSGEVLQKALSESARTTMERDEDVRERFLALDRRLADAPKATGSGDPTTRASDGPYRPSADSTGGGGSW